MTTDDLMNQFPVQTDAISMAWIPGIALVSLSIVLYCSLRREQDKKRLATSLLWSLPQAITLVVLIATSLNRLYISGYEQMAFCSIAAALSASLTLCAPKMADAIEAMDRISAILVSSVRDFLLLILISLLSFFIIEIPWNDRVTGLIFFHVLLNFALIVSFYLALYLLGGRRGSVLCVGIVLCTATGLAQYFVALFKSSAIVPGDLFALGTAAAVSGGYTYEFGSAQIIAVGLAMIAIALASFMRPIKVSSELSKRGKRAYVLAHAGAGLLIVSSLFSYINTVSFIDDLGLFENGFWDSLNTYRNQGFVPSFIALAQNQAIKAPEGYVEDDALAIQAQWAEKYSTSRGMDEGRIAAESQFKETTPTVIAVMNESFSDLSIYSELYAGYMGPMRLKSIPDALYRGYVYASVLGGGTCNSEFEFLTGASMGYVGASNSPYVTHNLSGIPSLPKHFSSLGYKTTAIHPESRSNWNRETVYEQIGFDQFLDRESFASLASVRHAGITDAETYSKILELLNSEEGPQFIFDVTMQNHGGYGWGTLPEWEQLSFDFSWMDEQCARETAEYVSLIEQSDRELLEFIEELRNVNKPVVLLVFGDHQPWMGEPLNQATNPGLDVNDPAFFERAYMTPYAIWANYDVAGNDQVSQKRDLGINSLQAMLLDLIGTPLSEQHMAEIGISQHLSIINGFAYFSADDAAWHSLELANNEYPVLTDWQWMQYLNYGSKM